MPAARIAETNERRITRSKHCPLIRVAASMSESSLGFTATSRFNITENIQSTLSEPLVQHPIATESEVNDVHASEILRARVQLPANATNGLNDQKEFAFVRVIRGS